MARLPLEMVKRDTETLCEWWGAPLAVEHAASLGASYMGLPFGKPLVGHLSKAKHLLNRWGLPRIGEELIHQKLWN